MKNEQVHIQHSIDTPRMSNTTEQLLVESYPDSEELTFAQLLEAAETYLKGKKEPYYKLHIALTKPQLEAWLKRVRIGKSEPVIRVADMDKPQLTHSYFLKYKTEDVRTPDHQPN